MTNLRDVACIESQVDSIEALLKLIADQEGLEATEALPDAEAPLVD